MKTKEMSSAEFAAILAERTGLTAGTCRAYLSNCRFKPYSRRDNGRWVGNFYVRYQVGAALKVIAKFRAGKATTKGGK